MCSSVAVIRIDASRSEDHIQALADQMSFSLSQEQRQALGAFAALVSKWGQKTDLVAGKDPASLMEILFCDAFELAHPSIIGGGRLIDVGAGAGAPGVPLALLRPELEVTLLEPRRRRVAFMRTAVGALGLSGRVKVVEGRLEETPPQGAPWDVAMSRATFEPPEWLRRGSEIGARVLVLLGRLPTPSLEGWSEVARRPYRIPTTDASRSIVAFEGA